MGAVERGNAFPPVVRGGHSVGRTVDGEEPVSGVVVAVELELLVVAGEDVLQFVHLLR
jgi:hypothetical protein